MKRLFAVLFPVLLLVFAMGSANAKDLKIGVINLRDILQAAPQAKAMNEKLAKQFKPRQEKMVAAQKTLKANIEKLHRDGTVMTESQKTKLQQTIVQEKRDLERLGQDYQQDLSLAQNQAMHAFLTKLKTIVNKIAKKDHYDLILQKDGVPYSNPQVDLTQKVIKQLS